MGRTEAPLVGAVVRHQKVSIPGRVVVEGPPPASDASIRAWLILDVVRLTDGILSTRAKLMESRRGAPDRWRVDTMLAAPLGTTESVRIGDPDAAREVPPRGNVMDFHVSLTPSLVAPSASASASDASAAH